jgi:hypothetical protein
MIMRTTRTCLGPAALAALLCTAPALAQDTDPRAVPVFDARFAVADILATAKERKKALKLVLRGGASYTGLVKDVGAHAVVLTRLSGKEFFDAYVPLRAIVALEERVRMR